MKVNLNSASLEEIKAGLLMIGSKRAQDIVSHRPYRNWNDFKSKVPGMSQGMLEDIQSSGGTIE